MKRHHISHAALSLGAVVAAVVFFVVGAGVRLLVGPVSLGPLQETLAGAIQQALPGITLAYDKAAIEWDREQNRVELVVLGTRILDQDGKVVASAPKADIQLAAAPFLHGQVAVQRITLVGVSFSLVHMKGGGIRLGAEGGKVNDVYERLNDVITAKGSNSSSLKSFAVRDAHLTVFDEVTGLNLTAPRANLSITARTDLSLATGFDADVILAHAPAPLSATTHIKADLILPADDKNPITGSATVSHLNLSALSANAPLFRPLHLLALNTDLTTKFSVTQDGSITETDFDLSANGDIPFPWGKDKTIQVHAMRLMGHYDGVTKHLSLTEARLDSREADLTLKGGADLVYANGELDSISADIASVRASLVLAGVLPGPVQLQSAQFKGVYHANANSFDIERAVITAPAFNLDVKGTAQLGKPGQSPGMELVGTEVEIPVRTLLRYWPMQVAPGAREWIEQNIFAGTMGPINFQTHFTPGMLDLPVLPDDALSLSFAMNGVEGNYLDGLTHVTGVSGSATLTGDNFTADFEGGHVGNLMVSKGRALIPTLHVHGTVGQFSAHIDGPMPEVMALIDMKPLQYPTKFGVDPKTTLGSAGIDLSLQVPMLVHNADKLGILVKAHVDDFAVALGKLRLINGAVDFTVDNNTLHQSGIVQLADTKLNVDWVEDLESKLPITTHLNVKGTMTEAARAALNVGLASILTGPVGVQGTLSGQHGQLKTAELDLDLTPAAVLVPIVHLGKPAGQAAQAHASINFGANDNLQDETLRITGPNLSANGVVNFDKNGVMTQMNFPSVKMGTLNDLSFILARNATGDTYTLRGHSMDGSLVGRNGDTKPGAPGVNASVPKQDETPAGAYHIDAKLDRLAMRDGVAIAPFSMDLSGVGERPGMLALSGTLTQTGVTRSGALSGSVVPTAQGRQFNLEAGDAGLLMRGLFAFESLRQGKLVLTAALPGKPGDPPLPANQPDYTGKLEITDFTMVNQSFLSRLFAAGSLTGVGDLLGGQGISVDKLDVPFSSKNNVISIKDSIVSGPAVGGTADGYIDRPKNLLALKGSMVPAYGLNSIISNVPLLGDLLASKKGEGIIGVTYSATGNADEPKIDVNPLSALTPGILRRIFQGNMPNAANAPSNKEEPVPPANAQSNAAAPQKPAAN